MASGHAFAAVTVLQTTSGSVPTGCASVNNSGVAVSLDLDGDSTLDLCLGSSTTICGATVNLDCAANTGGTTSQCSIQAGGAFMGGDPTATALAGQSVGPNVGATTVGSINNIPTETLLYVGFKGGSAASSAGKFGYFSLTIDSTTCAYTFGAVNFESSVGAGITFPGGTPVSAPIIDLKMNKAEIFATEVELK